MCGNGDDDGGNDGGGAPFSFTGRTNRGELFKSKRPGERPSGKNGKGGSHPRWGSSFGTVKALGSFFKPARPGHR